MHEEFKYFKGENVVINEAEVGLLSELYMNSKINYSILGQKCIIGDFSRITNSNLEGLNRIDRNTLVYYSSIGLGSYVGMNSILMHSLIGRFCSIAWSVSIGPANHDYKRLTTHDFLYNDFYDLKTRNEIAYDRFNKKTNIGNDVWIGANVTIANGLKIGDGAVIGANAMVTKDVEPYSIVVGNPGKVLKFRFRPQQIEELLNLKWWNLPLNVIKENYSIFKSDNIDDCILKLKKIIK